VVIADFTMGSALRTTPHWVPTYNMTLSTALMPCNYSGMFDAAEAARWGMADFDCEELARLKPLSKHVLERS
jgi:hypothetical protein